MPVRTTLASWRLRGIFELPRIRSSSSVNVTEQNQLAKLPTNFQINNPRTRVLRSIGSVSGGMGMDDKPPSPTPPPPAPPLPQSPPEPGPSNWGRWFLGIIFSAGVAFSMPKWGTLLKIGGEAEVMLEEAEKVAEVVEKVAAATEKVSAEVVDQFPNDNMVKEAALLVEHASEETVKDAHLIEQIIHKVDEVKQDLEGVEKLTEPVIDKIFRDKQPGHKL
ncbi:hypothetical protein Nepgr_019736 [Nepenthes gracilis]|uniref:Uncharacterized protein n=1 Tax=Nepenthes gracilis TaxID=150966 RepID=A0AAD3XVI3_NEPGR|nr:hypothetical protein Nepgr_019736 [Nepenthes gracilis]